MDMFDRLIAREGGYNFDPDDPGGETHWGISKKSYPHLDIKSLTKDQARAIYVRDYYYSPHINLLPNSIQEQVLDWYVTSGRAAIKAYQRLTNITVDGKIGVETSSVSPPSSNLYALERNFFYARLCVKNPKLLKFLIGWQARALSFVKDN